MRSKNYKSVRHPNEIVRAEKDGEVKYFFNASQASKGLGFSEPMAVRSLNCPQERDWKAYGWRLTYIPKSSPECQEFLKGYKKKIEEKEQKKKANQRKVNRKARREAIYEMDGLIRKLHSLELAYLPTWQAKPEPLWDKLRRMRADAKKVVNLTTNTEYPNIYQAQLKDPNSQFLWFEMSRDKDVCLGAKEIDICGTRWRMKDNLVEQRQALLDRIDELHNKLSKYWDSENDKEEIDGSNDKQS